nr:PREDICTED: deoxynucleoside kinase-like [Bemisia tabaci]
MLASYSDLGESHPYRISLEGGIAAGKSCVMDHLDDYVKRSYTNLIGVVSEPIFQWKSYRGINWLKLFYEDPAKYSFQFQNVVLQTLANWYKNRPMKVLLTERSLDSCINVFARCSLQKGYISANQYEILRGWRDIVCEQNRMKTDCIIYLKTSPAICYERMKQRNRLEEKAVTLEYLQELEGMYDDWLCNEQNVYIVNGDRDQREIYEQINLIIDSLTSKF